MHAANRLPRTRIDILTSKKEKPAALPPWKPIFLESLANTGNVRLSAAHAGVSRQMVYQAKASDSVFAEAFDDARDEAADILERECWRRATVGVERKRSIRIGTDLKTRMAIYEVVVEREYSDNLLMFLLKGARPDVYREHFDAHKVMAIYASLQEPAAIGKSRASEDSGGE